MYTANSINPLFTSLVFLRMLCWKINHFPTSFACWDAYLARGLPSSPFFYIRLLTLIIPITSQLLSHLKSLRFRYCIQLYTSQSLSQWNPQGNAIGICSHLSVSSLRLFTLAPRRLPERPHIGPKLPTRPKGRTQEGPKSDQKWGVWVEFKHQTCGFYMDFNGVYIYIYYFYMDFMEFKASNMGILGINTSWSVLPVSGPMFRKVKSKVNFEPSGDQWSISDRTSFRITSCLGIGNNGNIAEEFPSQSKSHASFRKTQTQAPEDPPVAHHTPALHHTISEDSQDSQHSMDRTRCHRKTHIHHLGPQCHQRFSTNYKGIHRPGMSKLVESRPSFLAR